MDQAHEEDKYCKQVHSTFSYVRNISSIRFGIYKVICNK